MNAILVDAGPLVALLHRAVAERKHIRRIFTLDKRDFSIYRPLKLQKFVIIP